ncbi:hypothetical protein A2421_03285 [Candidatus Woesebacteria bacterium RIFOXYC1_FULL_43_18]|nr:MAG: hypothetical protein A2421_03285 [Candidatus Woesebacteria bacterium RIFOXYC1_FULL_43_18]
MFKDNDRSPFFWIVGLSLLTYIWTIFFGFVYFDDQELILNNLFFLKNLANIPAAFVTDAFRILHASAAYYRPLLTVSFMLDAQLSGSSPFLYHLTNVIIHTIASCVVFVFLQKIKIKREISFLFSIIFTVHPLLSQAVTWIPARDNSLLALFSLLSFIYFINFFESGKTKDAIWHLVFFGAALFTKELGLLTAPVIVLYLLLFEKKRFLSGKLKIPFAWAGIVGFWYILRSFALQDPVRYSFEEAGKGIYIGLQAVVLDIGKVFFPVNLSILPPVIQVSTLIWGFIAIALIIVSIVFSKNKNNKLVLFGTALFFVFLLPSFIRPGTGYELNFFEYRMYLPIIGLFIIFSEIEFVKKFNFSNKKSVLLLGGLISLLIIINYIYSSVYRDKLALWQSAVLNSPQLPLAHKNLGAMNYLAGDLDKAEIEFKRALELSPQEPMIHNNLGLIFAARGELAMAEEEYKKELEVNPRYSNALFNYGIVLYRQGRISEAEQMWLETLEVNPDYIDAMKNLFVLYYTNKDMDRAGYYYTELQKRGISLQ